MKMLWIFISLLIATPSFATTRYVTKAGSNANSCAASATRATAKLTITAGIACMSGGDTLLIGDGTYDERVNNTIPSGSIGAPTVVKAENTRLVILAPNLPSLHYVIYIDGKTYITLDGLIVDATTVISYPLYWLNSTFLIFQNGTARHGQGEFSSGINMGLVNDSQLLRSEFYENGQSCGVSNCAHGIYLAGMRNIVDGNLIYGNQAYCAQIYSESMTPTDNIFRNNTCRDNVNRGFLTIGLRSVIYNNVFDGNAFGIILRGTQHKIYNNTIYGNTQYCVQVESGSGHISTNNICEGNATDTIATSGGASITKTTDRCDSGCFTAGAPVFVGAATGAFSLQASSLLLNIGTTVPDVPFDSEGLARPQGSSYELGAHEFDESTPPPGEIILVSPVTGTIYTRPQGNTIRIEWWTTAITGNLALRYSHNGGGYVLIDAAVPYNNNYNAVTGLSFYDWPATLTAGSLLICIEQDAADCAGTVKDISGAAQIHFAFDTIAPVVSRRRHN